MAQISFSTGGTVQASRGVYIERAADRELLEHCRAGRFAYVLTTRQMGKSSLMVRTAEALAPEALSVRIDLTKLGTQLTAEQWYMGILDEVADQLRLQTDVLAWWEAHDQLGNTHRMLRFLERVVLSSVSKRIIVFIDEIDTTMRLNFTDDFFAAIRYIYNARVENRDLERLSFVLLGVASPGDLIQDEQRTPFNIGSRVELKDFLLSEAKQLAPALTPLPLGEEIIISIYAWTKGHPYLTVRACREVQLAIEKGRVAWQRSDVDELMTGLFLGEGIRRDSNLQFVRDMLTKFTPDIRATLETYRAVRKGRRVCDEEQAVVKSHLKLSGVVIAQGGFLVVRNPIYERVFDIRWIDANMPSAESRYRRLRQIALMVTSAAVGLALLIAAFVSYRLRQDALKNSLAHKLIVDSIDVARANPALLDLSALLAVESLRLSHTRQAMDRLREAARLLPSPSRH